MNSKDLIESIDVKLDCIVDVLKIVYEYIERIPSFNDICRDNLTIWDTTVGQKEQISLMFIITNMIIDINKDIALYYEQNKKAQIIQADQDKK